MERTYVQFILKLKVLRRGIANVYLKKNTTKGAASGYIILVIIFEL